MDIAVLQYPKIFPENFKYVITYQSEDNKRYTIRAALNSAEEVHSWVRAFEASSLTQWDVMLESQPNQRRIFHKYWACRNRRNINLQKSKEIVCFASLDIKIKKITPHIKKYDKYLRYTPPLNAIIEINLQHDHISPSNYQFSSPVPDTLSGKVLEELNEKISFHKKEADNSPSVEKVPESITLTRTHILKDSIEFCDTGPLVKAEENQEMIKKEYKIDIFDDNSKLSIECSEGVVNADYETHEDDTDYARSNSPQILQDILEPTQVEITDDMAKIPLASIISRNDSSNFLDTTFTLSIPKEVYLSDPVPVITYVQNWKGQASFQGLIDTLGTGGINNGQQQNENYSTSCDFLQINKNKDPQKSENFLETTVVPESMVCIKKSPIKIFSMQEEANEIISTQQKNSLLTEGNWACKKEKKFTCEVCEISFNYAVELGFHKKVHYKYHCDFCKKTFVYRYSLTTHLATHTGEKNYKCDLCKKSYHAKRQILSHFRTVHRKRQTTIHKCHFCDKTFSIKDNLKRHLLIHIVEKSECKTCEKQCAQISYYFPHINSNKIS